MKRLFLLVQIPDKSENSIRLMIFDMFRRISSLVIEINRKFRVQVSSLVQPALDFLSLESGLLKYRVIRQEVDRCACFSRLACFRQQAVLQLDHRNAPLVTVMVYIPLTADLHVHISRQRIHNGRTHAVKSAACLVCRIIKFTACMEGGEHKPCSGDAFLMHPYRNSAAVIRHRSRAVLFKNHADLRAVACQMFVHGIVHDLIDQMVQALCRHTSYIHTRTLADSFKPFQNRYTVSIISIITCHLLFSF